MKGTVEDNKDGANENTHVNDDRMKTLVKII